MATEQSTSEVTREFRTARDFLVAYRDDYETAYRDFTWPAFDRFNWACDWFDALAVEQPEVAALTIVDCLLHATRTAAAVERRRRRRVLHGVAAAAVGARAL